ncbi:MAG: ATP-grasp domain-containing protein [Treponemataceae bacterium]|nr:ATP-grasp domain-containing protein [Treponemataceae bacterium]
MNSESVLILGAGEMQRPAIAAAKQLGYKAAAVDANPNAAAVMDADVFGQVDLKDREAVLAFARRLSRGGQLRAVFTAGTDFSASAAYAAEALGLPGHSFEAACNASIKPRMRACFAAAGVPSPQFFSVSKDGRSEAEFLELCARRASEELGFPCVVKPADNMGARGCRMVRNAEEAAPAAAAAVAQSRSSAVIFERYMDGPEFSIDAVVFDGTMTVAGFAARHIFYQPYFIETGHTMPAAIDEAVRLELISTFALGVKALGLTHGAAKADIKYTENGPEIGEIAARLSGGYMSGWTFPYASGCNLTEQALLVACGRTPERLVAERVPIAFAPPASCVRLGRPFELYEVPCRRASAERAWISIPGIVGSVCGEDSASGVPNVRNILPRPLQPGSAVDFPRNNVQKCGNVISCAPTVREAAECAELAASRMFVRLGPRCGRTERFLAGDGLPDESGFPPPAFSAFEKVSAMELSGTIPEDVPVLSCAGAEVLALLDAGGRDWSYMTAREAAELFDRMFPRHPPMDRRRFWSALFRGGLQAAVYVSDSSSENQ